jgi:hypothetical protein
MGTQAKFLPLCDKYLAGFPISHVGFSTTYAARFFAVPNVSFNMLQAVLMGPIGGAFVRKAKSLKRPIFAWTVNDEKKMRWGIDKELDGIITDDPQKYLDVCKEVENETEDGKRPEAKPLSVREWMFIVQTQLLVSVFFFYFSWKFGFRIDQSFVRKAAVRESISVN